MIIFKKTISCQGFMKFLFLLFTILFSGFHLFSQAQYGNEWIRKNQQYAKIKITEKGVYRINHNQLQSLGFLNSNPDPKKIQLFYLGAEIPIHIIGENDGLFDATDYIEFYAEPNNGKADEILYKPGEQPNPEVSLFTDEAIYFLTLGEINGKRFNTPTINSAGLTPESHILYTSSGNYAEQYYPGQYVLDIMTYSDYIEGEGYLGQSFGLENPQTRTLNTPNYFSGSSFQSYLDFYVAGRSNASSTNASQNNHHLRVTIGNTTLKDTIYRGYRTIRSTTTINSSLSATTNLTFSSINDLGAVTDFQALGYVRITYPRSFDGSGFNTLSFKTNSTNNQCLLNFTNTSWSNAFLIDPTNNMRYAGIKNGNTTSFSINNSNNKLFLYDVSTVKTTVLEPVTFNLIDANTFNAAMLIVTHKSLLSGANAISTYKNIRGISSNVITTEELYNQFYYGLHHPLAIRNYSRYLLEKAAIKPEYLFLIGKGYEYSKQMISQELVPTMGYPPSDNLFTSNITDNTLAPSLATGRIPAKTVEEVNDYLIKMQLYDQQPNAIWRKTIINITGGGNSSEDNSFSSYLKALSNIAEKEHFGASTVSYYKSVTDPITEDLTTKINKSIEDGANLVTYLGHGSTTGTAVSVGKAENIQRILFFLINGCSTGNAFTTGTSLGESYIFQKEKAAIGWIGTSSEGVASYLSGVSNQFYQNSFKNYYGESIAKNLSRSIRTYQNPNDALNKIHCQQFIFLGDPSSSFYSPTKPDYEIEAQNISILENNITANSPNFNLALIVKNNGKAIVNNLKISISRTLSDNTVIKYPVKSFNNIFNTDTIHYEIINDILNASGNNKFTISIDPDNEVDELNKQNNIAEFNHFFPSNGITIISPNEFGIENKSDLSLRVQAKDLFTKNAEYIFEIDTIDTFNSSWKKTSGLISSGLFANWLIPTSLENEKVYYWRARLNTDINNGGQWQTSSFTYILNGNEGWSQAHQQQFKNISLSNITEEFKFTNTFYPIQIRTRGNDSQAETERRIRLGSSNASPAFNSSDFTGIGIIALSPINSNLKFNYPSDFNFKNDDINGSGVFFFNPNIPLETDSLIRYISNIPNDFFILGVSGRDFSPKNLPEAAKVALRSLGLSDFENVNNGEPYVFVSRKGAIVGSGEAVEKTASSSEDIIYMHNLLNPWDNGYYESSKIGPSKKWNNAVLTFSGNQNDVISHSIIGININGIENVLKSNITDSQINLEDIDANQYPYIKLKTNVSDNLEYTAPALSSWKVLFESYPELTFNPEFLNLFYSKELQEGDSLKISIGITNLKQSISDSLQIRYKITKDNRSNISGILKPISPLIENQNASFYFSYPSVGLSGNNVVQLSLEPKDSKDHLDFNNFINYDFKVISDLKNPSIDLLFDGKRIINGETISPKPNITISVMDENKYLLLSDTSAIEVYLKNDSDIDYKRIFFSSNNIVMESSATEDNNKATFILRPGLLEDGLYTLKINAKDKLGNSSNNPSLTEFEVINEQTITNFLPYPNPVTTYTRFVFKITGEKVPDKIKIQIMTVSGKIVREINKDELGHLNIGNNLSEFRWDGTDMYGDRLANGVYFYQVKIENNDGSSIKKKYNITDNMFKNNFGKIYLMK
jgi:hypothetical protein